MQMNQYYIQSYPDQLHTKVITVPIFEDNYVYILTDDSKNACVVDPGAAIPVVSVVEELGLQPTQLLITHSHHDHIGGVIEMQQRYPLLKIFDCSSYTSEFQCLKVNDHSFEVFITPGHWPDHICFFEKQNKILFCGDILFRFGCGRIFDGTMSELYESLQKIKKLPPDTNVYCTHEYTKQNLAFCLTHQLVDPSLFTLDEKQKINSVPSLPVPLSTELKYNPFIKANSLDQFTQLRQLRNSFKYCP